MPWLLQPKSYTQIARPNLYNVAYRRVGTYKGMGRLHPTNYLQIGYRPNMIGATTGQYNTLSGQLSLLPPSLRGLGQGAQCPSLDQLLGNVNPADPCQGGAAAAQVGAHCPSLSQLLGVVNPADPCQAGSAGTAVGSTAGFVPGTPAASWFAFAPGGAQYQAPAAQPATTNYIPWIIGGALFLVLLAGGRR